ncbi:hypothetical protein [Rhizorhapis suberifaciens]|uniref:Uncharacterized protein n=1 Tax=Rhizorhapis suberifaciens TaxID=13656 RepID=A0A840HWD1_9SPHN|nr:hypothetical protein [Rhizorhapis suberifaciens]MBB4642375.1 hypothetical protein [Rhizorhapis suberifaciens]
MLNQPYLLVLSLLCVIILGGFFLYHLINEKLDMLKYDMDDMTRDLHKLKVGERD